MGKPSGENFDRWFKNSAVVDGLGEPLVVYHGTNADAFERFDPDRASPGWHGFGGSFFFSAKPARDYGETVMQVYLSLQNPKVFGTVREYSELQSRYRQSESMGGIHAKRDLLRAGYDGVIIAETGTYVAFFPNQIKAVDNRGTWDGNSDNLREDKGDFMDSNLAGEFSRCYRMANIREGKGLFNKDPAVLVFEDALKVYRKELRKGSDKFDALCAATKAAEDLAGERGLTQNELSKAWRMIQDNA